MTTAPRWILLLAGGACLLGGLLHGFLDLRFRYRTSPALGVVKEIRENGGGATVTVQFQTATGREIVFERREWSSDHSWCVGQIVDVRYASEDPAGTATLSEYELATDAFMMLLGGALFACGVWLRKSGLDQAISVPPSLRAE